MVTDLQTGEGAIFRPGGLASYDLDKNQLWVCVLFEDFLTWLYKQDLTVLQALPRRVELDTESALWGHRRLGPGNLETHDPTRGSDPVEHAEPATQDDGGVRV
jgi:hypothetical protein